VLLAFGTVHAFVLVYLLALRKVVNIKVVPEFLADIEGTNPKNVTLNPITNA